MLVVTTENVSGHRVTEVKGQCFGVVVRSRGLGGNIMAGLRSIVGGEIHEYTQLLEEARRHAIDRLVENAAAMGANAVLMMRFDSAEIGETMSEIVAYGTAAVIERAAGVSSSVMRSALLGVGLAMSAGAVALAARRLRRLGLAVWRSSASCCSPRPSSSAGATSGSAARIRAPAGSPPPSALSTPKAASSSPSTIDPRPVSAGTSPGKPTAPGSGGRDYLTVMSPVMPAQS